MSGELKLWEMVEKTDPAFTQKVDYGRHKFTAIDSYYQIKNATRMFGPYGGAWLLSDIEYELIPNVTMYHVTAIFNYPGGQFPISTAIKYADNSGNPDEDFAKKAETSLISKSLSRLGFNADVFMGMYEDNQYLKSVAEEFRKPLYTDEQQQAFIGFIETEDALGLYLMSRWIGQEVYIDLFNSFPKGQKSSGKAAARNLEKSGKTLFDACVEAIDKEEKLALLELYGEDRDGQFNALMKTQLNGEQRIKFDYLVS